MVCVDCPKYKKGEFVSFDFENVRKRSRNMGVYPSLMHMEHL